MFTNFFWLIGAVCLAVQIISCIFGKNTLIRLLPMAVTGIAVLLTLIGGIAIGGLGFFAAFAFAWGMLKVFGMTVLGYGIWRIAIFTKK